MQELTIQKLEQDTAQLTDQASTKKMFHQVISELPSGHRAQRRARAGGAGGKDARHPRKKTIDGGEQRQNAMFLRFGFLLALNAKLAEAGALEEADRGDP